MDSTAGSGHRPVVVVGATIHPWANRAVCVASGQTRPKGGQAEAAQQSPSLYEGDNHLGWPSAMSLYPLQLLRRATRDT
jgi:hypothetical protein